MKINKALTVGQDRLSPSPSPSLDARLILEHVLQTNHSFLVSHGDDRLRPDQEHHFRSLLERAALGEPIPYLLEETKFYGLDLKISPAALIPRPETELLVDAALEWLRSRTTGRQDLRIVDVGTGSGCVALAIASRVTDVFIEGTDVSEDALELALENSRILGLDDRVKFHFGNLLEPVSGEIDLIVANLPYIADHEWSALDVGVKWYEPDVALRGGSDGLDGIRQLLDQASMRLTSGGAMFLEIGWEQGEAASRIAQSTYPSARVDVLKDLGGRDRVLRIQTVA